MRQIGKEEGGRESCVREDEGGERERGKRGVNLFDEASRRIIQKIYFMTIIPLGFRVIAGMPLALTPVYCG